MYESKHKPLAPTHIFYKRLAWNFLFSAFILIICLLIGIVGYHYFAKAPWIDAFHNASMILSGMGPVYNIPDACTSGKIFSSFYALFSGVVFITNIGILLAPAMHRIFHKLQLEED